MAFRLKRKSYNNHEINPDEIFLDSSNLPDFDKQQFEGVIEKPIASRTINFFSVSLVLIALVFVGKLFSLQIARGEFYYDKSLNNSLTHEPIFAERGIIYDRNGVELAWNEKTVLEEAVPERKYFSSGGFSHLLGYVGYPKKDEKGFYWQKEFIGKAGIESIYNDKLDGENGTQLVSIDVYGNKESENQIINTIPGENINLSIDSRVQSSMYEAIKNHAETFGFTGGAGIMMDIDTGEILAITNYPEYSSEIMSKGSDSDTISSYQTSSGKPYLNRAVAGLYTPGSIVKPFVAMGVLTENIIDPLKQIYSSGSISITSPYDPEIVYTYKDNKAHGYVDLRRAIAVSSNVYFYAVSGGYQDQEGLGIDRIEKYTKLFGLDEELDTDLEGEKKGTIPSREWKKLKFKGDDWRIGDTYNTSIGQYGFQVTPLSMARSVGAIANNGTLVTPHALVGDAKYENTKREVGLDPVDYQIVREGMRMVVTEGSAQSLSYLPFNVAAKTGTAQVGLQKNKINSWIIGFFPYENPKYSFAILMESGPTTASGAIGVAREVLTFVGTTTPEYIK